VDDNGVSHQGRGVPNSLSPGDEVTAKVAWARTGLKRSSSPKTRRRLSARLTVQTAYYAMFVDVSAEVGVRLVSELCHIPAETVLKHRVLPRCSDAYRCCGKLLMGTALVRFDLRRYPRPESISKRARSTTPTSLRFRINELRAANHDYRTRWRLPITSSDLVCIKRVWARTTDVRANCVRPLNVPGSLTVIYSSCICTESRARPM
jgi:hypothetical protein